MVKERYSNISPNQKIVSDQSELTILLCQPMNSLLLMKTTLPWYSGLQPLPSYIYDPCQTLDTAGHSIVNCHKQENTKLQYSHSLLFIVVMLQQAQHQNVKRRQSCNLVRTLISRDSLPPLFKKRLGFLLMSYCLMIGSMM